jgi:hypothetical protein
LKRFTEALKWRDPWFRNLSVDGKLVFFYFVDNCDAAGVWDPDLQMANFCLKRDIDWDAVWKEFGDRVVKLPNGKLWMRKFIHFQYGPELNPKNSAHLGVIRRLELAGISYPPTQPLESPSVGASEGAKDKDMDKDKDKDKDKDRDQGTEPEVQPDLFGGEVTTPPAAPSSPTFASQPADRANAKNPLQRRAEKLFKRRESTVWDGSERKAWEKSRAAITATSEEDWALLEWFYALHPKTDPPLYRRRDLAQLLNNWGAEIDRARAYRASNPCPKVPAAPATVSDIYTEPPDWRERAAAKWPGVTLPEKWADLSPTLRNDLLNSR